MSISKPSSVRDPRTEVGTLEMSSAQRTFPSFRSHRSSTVPSRNADDVDDTRLGLNELYSPDSAPIADFIFVHGLRGGSLKTWRKYKDSWYFWPKAWFPLDDDLSMVRTSSFGYQSDWLSRKESILDVHDFGRKLLGDMQTSAYLRRAGRTPIVLVGHSMGGLVIKKAYLLASRECPDLADRIKSIVFLATPHRGSDSADLLHNILELAGNQKPFVDDLVRSSPSLQRINDEFCYVADELDLWSFFEERKMRVGLRAEFVVGRDSAILGYKHEKRFSLDANHREICKFEGPEDENYRILRNAIVTILDQLQTIDAEGMEGLRDFLHPNKSVAADLDDLMASKTAGTCEWIEGRANFQNWLGSGDGLLSPPPCEPSSEPNTRAPDSVRSSSQLYWLTAQPGAGKSVCSAHVITKLVSQGYQCSYFFFQDNVRGKQTLNDMLRSIALQMANYQQAVRTAIHAVKANGVDIDKDSDDAVWRCVFVQGIFKVNLSQTQIWVLDALDECLDGAKFPDLLKKTKLPVGLRIFAASRPQPDIERGVNRLSAGMQIYQESISQCDTEGDIMRYISSEDAQLDLDDREERLRLEQQLLSRCNGCFLWVKLVIQDLENVYLQESIGNVLDKIPDGMSALYQRSLTSIVKATREKKLVREKELTKALLLWAVCARRPLSLTEIELALNLDSEMQVRDLRRSIDACGNLLYVDRNSRVQLIHSTLRDFLFDRDLQSEFAIRRQDGHERLALACLKHMEQTMRPPRGRSVGRSLARKEQEQPVFEEYAATYFSEHIAAASSTSDFLLISISRWLEASVLSWIEHTASHQPSLYSLTRTARNFKQYLERRVKYVPPLGDEFKLMHKWTTDLVRLVAKFGRNLKEQPSAIFFLIPSIAPRDSMLYRLSLNKPKWLEVSGSANAAWDDCVSFIEYSETYATALAAGQNTIAIGMKNGAVILYDQSTCLEKFAVRHRVPKTVAQRLSLTIRLLAFDAAEQHFAAAGLQSICVWSIIGHLLYTFEISEPLVYMGFSLDQQAIFTVNRSSKIIRLSLDEEDDSDLRPPSPLDRPRSSGYVGSERLHLPAQAPLAAAISSDQTVVALLYRGKPIYLYGLEDDEVLGTCGRDAGSSGPNISVLTALFNPKASSNLLAVSHQDGDLSLYDTWTHRELASVYGDAYSLAATPDGQTLASGNTGGTVRLWEFETLTLLYVIRSGLEEVRSLAFAGDGSRLVDRRDTRIKVWEPSALIRKSAEEDASQSEAVALAAPEVGENDQTISTTAMCTDTAGRYIFAGRSDGSIVAFDIQDPDSPCATIHQARNDTFADIMIFENYTLAIANSTQTVQVWQLPQPLPGPKRSRLLLEKSFAEPIRELLLRPDGSHLLISTSESATVLHVETGASIWDASHGLGEGLLPGCWASAGQSLAVLRSDSCIDVCDWTSREHNRKLSLDHGSGMASQPVVAPFERLWQSQSSRLFAATTSPSYRNHAKTLVISCENPFMSDDLAETSDMSSSVSTDSVWNVRAFLGMCQERLVYLDHDLWICSLRLDEAAKGKSIITRHIFVPPEFVNAPTAAKPFITHQGNLVFSKEDKLGIIKGALDWSFA